MCKLLSRETTATWMLVLKLLAFSQFSSCFRTTWTTLPTGDCLFLRWPKQPVPSLLLLPNNRAEGEYKEKVLMPLGFSYVYHLLFGWVEAWYSSVWKLLCLLRFTSAVLGLVGAFGTDFSVLKELLNWDRLVVPLWHSCPSSAASKGCGP